MAPASETRIAIAGAGNIGCYVGGCLALAGRNVRFLARPRVADALRQGGLRLTDLDGLDRRLAPAQLSYGTDPAAQLAGAGVVLVTVKSGATTEMADTIARHAPTDAIVVSLQNGTGNVAILRERSGAGRTVVPGMVPFNVIQSRDADGALHMHRATSGTILIGKSQAGALGAMLDVPHASAAEHADMDAIQWGKLLLNLNNALNALSGIPLAAQLADPAWRRLLAGQMQEALDCFSAAGIRAIGTEGIPLWLAPKILSLPDWLFHLIARRMLAIDPNARSSMWEDLQQRRTTEIDHLQGAILAIARKTGRSAPLTERIISAVRAAEQAGAGSPHLQPEDIRAGRKVA